MALNVPTMEEFRAVLDYQHQLERRITLLEKKQLTGKYCSRDHAMIVLGVCATTLRKLDRTGVIISEKGARKVRYDVESLRRYLDDRRTDGYGNVLSALRQS